MDRRTVWWPGQSERQRSRCWARSDHTPHTSVVPLSPGFNERRSVTLTGQTQRWKNAVRALEQEPGAATSSLRLDVESERRALRQAQFVNLFTVYTKRSLFKSLTFSRSAETFQKSQRFCNLTSNGQLGAARPFGPTQPQISAGLSEAPGPGRGWQRGCSCLHPRTTAAPGLQRGSGEPRAAPRPPAAS